MIILNRREKLRASALPPEIPDGATLVKKTDKASATKLGLVKIGDNVDISSGGVISVPVGSSETAGVFKVGDGLSVDDGVLSATGGAGITRTSLFDETMTTGETKAVASGVHIFQHKIISVGIEDSANNVYAVTMVDLTSLAENQTTIKTTITFGGQNRELTITDTAVTTPANLGGHIFINAFDF